MVTLSWILGILGGLSAVWGIIIATEVMPETAVVPEVAGLTWLFWMVVGAILLLASIASSIGRGGGSYEE